jgi:hypothetical protein
VSARAALAQRRAAGVRIGGAPEIDCKVVGRIVRERTAGRTLQEVATPLNADGVPTARGGAWDPSTLQRVLRREQATT